MFVRKILNVNLTKHEICGKNNIWNENGLRFLSQSNSSDDDNETAPKNLKQWRPHWDGGKQKLATKLKIFDRGTRPSMDFIVMMNRPWDLSSKSLANWWLRKRTEIEIHDQRFVKKRHEILGSNLGAAHFLVHRGARVKFSGRPEWYEKDSKDNYNLPEKYEPNYVIEAIDAKGIRLYYEGLQNMRYLYELKSLCLKGCQPIDDWCLDRISSLYPRLQHLDISNCEKVSERGLESLYRIHSLRTLIVTNHHNSVAFELTCMMLEDCVPNLKVEIKPPESKPVPESKSESKPADSQT